MLLDLRSLAEASAIQYGGAWVNKRQSRYWYQSNQVFSFHLPIERERLLVAALGFDDATLAALFAASEDDRKIMG